MRASSPPASSVKLGRTLKDAALLYSFLFLFLLGPYSDATCPAVLPSSTIAAAAAAARPPFPFAAPAMQAWRSTPVRALTTSGSFGSRGRE